MCQGSKALYINEVYSTTFATDNFWHSGTGFHKSATSRDPLQFHNSTVFHDQILWWVLSINEALIALQGGKLWYRSFSEGASWNPYPALTWVCKVSVCLRSERHISPIMRTSWRHTPADWPSPAQTDSPTTSPSNPFPQTLETLSLA